MLIERPPELFRHLFPDAVFRIPDVNREIYLTFDDGPIPEATPWVLDILDRYGIKATFFMVGQNVERHPELLSRVLERGHVAGNHTLHHLQGIRVSCEEYMRDVEAAGKIIGGNLFRPPHGILKRSQLRELEKSYRIVMYDLVTRDYSRHLSAADVVRNVKRYTRPGSIIVFHDSLKSLPRIKEALPESIEWLLDRGYVFGNLSGRIGNLSVKGEKTV